MDNKKKTLLTGSVYSQSIFLISNLVTTFRLDGEVSVKEIEYLLDLSFKDYSIPDLPITFLCYIDFSKCLKTKIGN
ncbi:unnamed protein product [Rhizophagus irregularis]|nr:unnamed protein product [Rhizophagus irregularis]